MTDLQAENNRLKLRIESLTNEVAKWKRSYYNADKDRRRLERQEGERIERMEREQATQ